MEERIFFVINEMSDYLSIAQIKKLQEVLIKIAIQKSLDETQVLFDSLMQKYFG